MDSPLLTSVVLPAAIAVIMCSLGMTLTPADFRRVLVAPRGVAIGMLNLALISPLLALTTASLFGLSPELAVGLVLLGASPGGMMANMLTHLSKGDTALSVTMTAISSVGAIVTVPLFLAISTSWFDAGDVGDASMVGVVARVFAITIVPVAFGMWLRQRNPDADRGDLPARPQRLAGPLRARRLRRDRQRARHGRRERGRGRRRGARPQRRGDDDQLRRSPSWRGSTTARRPRSRSSSASTTRRWRSRSAPRWPRR